MNTWLKQPGSIKKLQLFLTLSIILNIFFLFNAIPKKEAPEKPTEAPIEAKAKKEVNETQIKGFVRDYLENFFNTDMASMSYIEKNSDKDLFTFKLKKQLELRAQNNIESYFNISNSFIEEIERGLFEVIIVGKESFKDPSYIDREVTIFLNIVFNEETGILLVQSIPRFEVK